MIYKDQFPKEAFVSLMIDGTDDSVYLSVARDAEDAHEASEGDPDQLVAEYKLVRIGKVSKKTTVTFKEIK